MATTKNCAYASSCFKKKKKVAITFILGCVLMTYTIKTNSNGSLFSLIFARECVENCDFFADGNATGKGWQLDVGNFYSSVFQNVTKDGGSVVFSAYLDTIKSVKKIRAIGMKDRDLHYDVYCLLWFKTFSGKLDTKYIIASGYIDPHPENFDRRWEAVHYTCSVPENRHPDAVSIVTNTEERPRNFVWLTDSRTNKRSKFTVCLHSPFDFKSDRSHEVVEWVELNRLMGGDQFILYNYSSSPFTDDVLKLYQKRGLVTVVQWNLPAQADIHYLGQVAAMTDCLYRSFYSSKYIVYLDLDEYIIPRGEKIQNWSDLLQTQPQRCAYIFRCTVFPVSDGYTSLPFEGKESALKYKLNTLLVHSRQNYVFNSKDRSKFILQTDCMEVVGVHLLQKYRTDKPSEMTVDPNDALLHHYREGYPLFVRMGLSVTDSFMIKYAKELIDNVQNTWTMLK